ncbi:cytochrome c oxidase accessory protein CcoG [Roseococcus sp. SDR]|uniref:cytochrome c oxidase accessory protein CcoG n=1 Tax=Roseococcus sp. SDR TaxID=2835532 RepID=UPI001BCE8EEE|nr:cytochrome c oxidase accessory protein CcoG [Roseococcus sp. SDR]MBS7790028.1 cytochrome c oxidase accessory protein CcoG [Roseococcus sp. SDR]MBV1845342.1 cytochrome c oxidase accessory protein CcoG [Roseococcus sp. SDR]
MSVIPPRAPQPEEASLYASHQKVYPRAVQGAVRRVKWAVLILLLGLYYIVPWLRWDRGPNAPNQAVLADMANARLFFFWFELWPQEIYFLTGILVLGAIGLFAVTSLFGRIWCGFTCPQTVWTDLFLWIERKIEGDRNARIKLDQGPRNGAWWRAKLFKHAAWFAIAMATGGAWIMYFNDAPTVTWAMLTGQASLSVYGFFALFTATTYVLAGAAREQVCTYMCPWPRFQGAMLDENSLVVTYRDWRGEPRGKPNDPTAGDCVDCKACVHVCPTGIDIRDGQQLECIGCGLCVDACDDVMKKLDRPTGLIAFETLKNLAASQAATKGMAPGAERLARGMAVRTRQKVVRPRTLVYAGVLTAVIVVMLGAWLMRETLTLTVLRDRAPLYVQLSDGGLRNGYTLKLANKLRGELSLPMVLEGPAGLRLTVQDAALDAEGRPLLTTRDDGITQWRAFVTAPEGLRLRGSTPITFRLLDAQGRTILRHSTVFLGPDR